MKPNIKKYIGEGLLIVFSVLFALFINKWFEDYQTTKQKNVAIKSITKELYQNQSILGNWKDRHIQIRDRITSVIEGKADSIETELKTYNYLNLGVLTSNETLFDAIISNTAWESARATGIITEFNYETIQKLTRVYSMQEVLTERTMINILDFYFDTDSHDMKNLNRTLTQFQLRFWELTGQEEFLMTLYDDAIAHLED